MLCTEKFMDDAWKVHVASTSLFLSLVIFLGEIQQGSIHFKRRASSLSGRNFGLPTTPTIAPLVYTSVAPGLLSQVRSRLLQTSRQLR